MEETLLIYNYAILLQMIMVCNINKLEMVLLILMEHHIIYLQDKHKFLIEMNLLVLVVIINLKILQIIH